jgi:hypothetical protein
LIFHCQNNQLFVLFTSTFFARLLNANKKLVNINLSCKWVMITAFQHLHYLAFEVPAVLLAKSQFSAQFGGGNAFFAHGYKIDNVKCLDSRKFYLVKQSA